MNLSQNPMKHCQKGKVEGSGIYFCIPHHITLILHLGKNSTDMIVWFTNADH